MTDDSRLLCASAVRPAANIGDGPVSLLITEKVPLDNRAIGIVTDRDIVVQAVAAGADPVETTLAEVMTSKIARVAHDVDAHGALEKMAALGIRRLAVTDSNGAIVGVLSFDDLVDGLAVEVADLARIIRQARTREAGTCGGEGAGRCETRLPGAAPSMWSPINPLKPSFALPDATAAT